MFLRFVGTRCLHLHNFSTTSSRLSSPLLKSVPKIQLSPLRFNSGSNPQKVKVKFNKQDVKRLFRFANKEGFVILGKYDPGMMELILIINSFIHSRRNWLPVHFLCDNYGGPIWPGEDPGHNLSRKKRHGQGEGEIETILLGLGWSVPCRRIS